MDETLREVIEHYVREGFQLSTLTPGGSATLVRDSEQIRLRLDGRWVLFDTTAEAEHREPSPARGAGLLVFLFAAAALAGAAGLVLIGFALLLDDDPRAPDAVATPPPTPTAAATSTATSTPPPTTTPEPTATATATPAPTPPPTPSATAPPLVTALVAQDQLLGPGARRILIEEAVHDAPFYVVVYGGDADDLGAPLAASALLAPGTHREVVVPLPRPAEQGEQLWVALHAEQNGNASFDGAAVDRALTNALTGSRGPQGEVAARIQVRTGAPLPPVSGSGGAGGPGEGVPTTFAVGLALLLLAALFGTRAAPASRAYLRS